MSAVAAFLKANWLTLAVGAGLLFAIWLADKRGYDRAEAEAEARRLERQQLAVEILADVEGKLDLKLGTLARSLNRDIQAIDTEEKTVVQPILRQEILRDPGLATRQCLTDELLRAINIARGSQPGDGEPKTARP